MGCPASGSTDLPPEIVYQDPVPLDSEIIVSSQLGAGGVPSASISRSLGDGGSLATLSQVTARGSDITFYTIGEVDFTGGSYKTDEGYGPTGTVPFIYNQVSETLDPKTNLEVGPSALGLTASNIILVDSSIINRIVYVPAAVFINVGLASSTKHSDFDGMLPADAGVCTLTPIFQAMKYHLLSHYLKMQLFMIFLVSFFFLLISMWML